MTDPEITNDHLVGVRGDRITMLIPVVAPMQVDEALRLAAWIVCVAVVANPDAEAEFGRVLKAVQNT